jgi:hypothetical protein
VITAVAATGITTAGATITWTTNEAADTQVELGTTTAYGQTTGLNASMVTAHSAALSGLSANTTYQYRVRSRDAAGNLAVSSNQIFTTAAAPAPITYTITATAGAGGSISPSGAVVVNAGASLSFTITPAAGYRVAGVTANGAALGAVTSYVFNNVTANGTIHATFAQIVQPPPPPPSDGTTLTGTVHAYSGNGPANLVSNAIPFKPGALTDARNVRILDGAIELALGVKVLAVWPQDSSIRSLLVQFSAPEAKNYTIEIGTLRTSVDTALLPVTWDVPQRILTLPAQYLSESLIFWEQKPLGQSGFPEWDSKQVSYYSRIENVGTATCANTDQFYDSITSTYQLYARTGDVKYLVNGRRWALHHRRDQVYLSGSLTGRGQCADNDKTRYVFPQGLVQDYFMFGDEEAKRVSGLIADNFLMPHAAGNYYIAPNTRGWWTEREAAFALIGLLAHYEATGNETYLDRVRERITSLHRMQVENGRKAWVHNLYDHDPSEGCSTTDWGSSPWMSGLLLEAVVKYHKLTGDPIARESVLMAVDDLRARYVATGDYANRSFVYLGCSAYQDGTPDLDNLISHAFGYAYRLTGNTAYRDFGTAVFNTSVEEGYTGLAKQYNQQFRSSGHFVAYVSGPTTADDTAPSASTTSPAQAAAVSGWINLTASASDNVGVAGVQFLVDGQPAGAEDTTAPYSVTFDTTTLANGSHTVAARARDAAGNITTSAAVTVTVANALPVDATPPVVSVTAPAASATVSGTINVTATATDNLGVAGVVFLVDGQARGSEDTAAPYALSLDTRTLTNGAHTIAARARDAAGNVATSAAVTVSVNNPTPDTTAPTVALTAPVNGQTVTGTLTLTATATDGVGVTGVQFLVDGQPHGAEDTSAPYTLALTTTSLANGSHTFAARARDAAGNTRTSAVVTVTVNNTVPDTTAPSVTLTSPTNGQTISGTITVSATASDKVGVVGVQFLVDGQARGAEDLGAPYSLSLNTTMLTNGSHTISARARDAAGNRRTASVTVTVANATTPPPSGFTPIRINAGGAAYTDPNGRVWAADGNFTRGYPYSVGAAIANTATPKLYQDQRVNNTPLVYTLTVPNGNYTVRLMFAELYHSEAGQRKFHVNVNGARLSSNFDVFAAAGGRDRAIDLTYPVSVTGGRIQIELTPAGDDAMLNALEITAR